MRKQSFISYILFVFIAAAIYSCGTGNQKEASIQEDAEEYVKIKCENRQELAKFANDSTITKPELDSIRRLYNKDLKKIRRKYSASKELSKKFEDAVAKSLATVPECDELMNQDGKGMKRK